MSDIQKKYNLQHQIINYFLNSGRDFPWRQPNLSPYEIIIAEILLKRTTATAVNNVYKVFIHKYPSNIELQTANDEDLILIISSLGLYNQRLAILKRMSEYIKEFGNIPDELDSLLGIPGIGQYSARAILSFAYNKNFAVVDSNVIRVYQRVFGYDMPQMKLSVIQQLADKLLPDKLHREYNLGLIDIGGLICKPIRPYCKNCPIKEECDYINKN